MHIRADSFNMDEIMDDVNVDSFELKPGPKDTSILHLQAEHRSTPIWNEGGGDVLRSRTRNPSSSRFPSLHPRMVPLLRDVGFDGVARLTGIQLHWSLITALVERWRSETHTFHLPVGECTITLQDVSIILGLRVDGRAITGSTEFKGGWSKLIQSMFGEAPGKHDMDGGRLKLNWLSTLLPALSDDANEDELIRYTQSYMLQLIGGILFTDHQGSQVHLMFLPLIQNLDRSRTLAWGAGVLAYLYRELCKACKKGTEEIAGCVLLLQLWAWTRLPTLAPVPRGLYVDNREIWGDLPGPFGLRWCVPKSFADASSHVLSIDRISLDVLGPDHFIWLPYVDVLDQLSAICREGNAIWCYKGPIICFHIVEPHEPDRCVRQFNLVQDIPSSPTAYSPDLHKMTLKGKTEIDWRDKHKDHILFWNNRLQYVNIIGNIGVGISDSYAEWYANITRPYLTRVAASQAYVFNILNCISSIAGGVVNGDYSTIDVLAAHGRRVLESQYSRGFRQDFPADDSFVEKGPAEVKLKKVGHKGGRGGVNAPKRRRIQNDDDRCDNINDDRNVHLGKTAASIEHEVADREVENMVIDPTPTSWIPNFDLIPDWSQSRQISLEEETTAVYTTPISSRPTLNLLSPEEFQPLVQDQQLTTHLTKQTEPNREEPVSMHPTFSLLPPKDFQPPVHEEQQPMPIEEHQPPPVEEQQPPPVEEQQPAPVVEQQRTPVEQDLQQPPHQEQEEEEWPPQPEEGQQRVVHGHGMRLRTRKNKGQKCGTDGYKHYVRLRKKYP